MRTNKRKEMMNFKDELGVIRPTMGDGIGAIFTEREGGVSSGPWGGVDAIMGLNVGSRVDDNAGCVRMNRSIVAQLTPSEPRWMTQVHGTHVVVADTVTDESIQADAQITTTPGVVCTVQVADCLPVLVADTKARGVAAIHAGWRGLAAGVIENAVSELRQAIGDESADMKVWLGPRIGFDEFETGSEVKEAFLTQYPQCTQGVKAKGDKWHIDLAAFARTALKNIGVTDVDDCGLCTVADPRRFYSFRRDGAKTGRHAALIWIEPK